MSRRDPPTLTVSAATSTAMSSIWCAAVQQGHLMVALLRVSQCMYG